MQQMRAFTHISQHAFQGICTLRESPQERRALLSNFGVDKLTTKLLELVHIFNNPTNQSNHLYNACSRN